MIHITKIYLVTNCFGDSSKVYIGKTKNSRETDHKKTYGQDIEYIYIDEINSLKREDWEPLETFWIEYYKFLGFTLMNIRKKGGGGPEFHTNKTREKMSIPKPHLNRPVIQYSLDGEFIKEFDSITKASSHISKSNPSIIENCLGKRKSSYGFIWRYKENPLDKNFKYFKNKSNKAIIQYDLEGNFIKEWNNMKEPSDFYDINYDGISSCCLGKQKTSGGFIWKYKNNK